MTLPAGLLAAPHGVVVDDPETSPVPAIDERAMAEVGTRLAAQFRNYVNDRVLVEQRYLRCLRQYKGVYDPSVESQLAKNKSRAYPRVTRVKCISTLSRIMNLMFPGNERNWTLTASPNAEMSPEDVMTAVQETMAADQAAGVQTPMTDETVQRAVQKLAEKRAERLMTVIDDQLQEIGGDQTNDYVALNRQVLSSGIRYGIGAVVGPLVREVQRTSWIIDPATGRPMPQVTTQYKPMFEFTSVWDLYPDMSARKMGEIDGYFTRKVMSTSQVNALKIRGNFRDESIAKFLKEYPQGNYREQPFESELRQMGTKSIVNDNSTKDRPKYEVIVWNGPLSGHQLQQCGVVVPEDRLGFDVDAEVWLLGDVVIKVLMNPWRRMGSTTKTLHTFIFDEDDSSPVGDGLPSVVRDSQMAVSAAARMLLDNASVACGPNLEVDTDRVRADQDITDITPYKIWYTQDNGVMANTPAVRTVQIDSHMPELTKIVELFLNFADMETFVGPATGGDMDNMPSEPMRTAAGASMLRGEAALPFKDIIRNHDSFTQSMISALVEFNRKFNPQLAPEGDYNVIARGATSLIAKEVRGQQLDQLATTLTPAEAVHVDARKLITQRLAVRDMNDLLVPEDEANRAIQAQNAKSDEMEELAKAQQKAEIRKVLSDALKNVAQAQKNSANADQIAVASALELMQAELTKAEDSVEKTS